MKKAKRNGTAHETLILVIVFSIALTAFFVQYGARATVIVTPASGGGAISADTSGGGYTSLTGPVITEGATADIGIGTITLNVPAGFVFDTGAPAVTVLVTRIAGTGGNNRNINNVASGTSVPVTGITATQITFLVTDATSNGVRNALTWQNIRVRPTAGTPLASGNILNTGTSLISGTAILTNYGTLTEVAGVKSQLAVTVPPSPVATVDTDFLIKPVVAVQDQFGNTVASDNATVVTHAAVLSTQACGGTPGTGTLTTAPASGASVSSGVLTYTAVQYSAAEAINICFSSPGIASALSTTVVVTATPPGPDTTAPAAVGDLAATALSDASVRLVWTAPGDDGNSGTAASYDIRYSTEPITEGNFDTATPTTNAPAPAVVGSEQTVTVTDLSADTAYYFAMKTSDEVPNTSALSNLAVAVTLEEGSEPVEEEALQKDIIPSEIEVSIVPDRCTTDPKVRLLLHAHDTAFVRISNLPDLSDAAWVPFEPGTDRTQTIDWTLSEGDGDKTVYFMFKGPFLDLVSPVFTATIKLDQATLCQSARVHAHLIDVEGHLISAQANPDCRADFAHATVEPYLVTLDGLTRGWKDIYVKVTSTSPEVTTYSFEDGDDFDYDDAIVRMERVGKTSIAHVESVAGSNVSEIRLRVDAADRGSVDEHVLWQAGADRDELPHKKIDLVEYRELCEVDFLPHPHPGEVFRSPSSELYYMGPDHRRHVFPDDEVLRSWYPDDVEIKIIATYQLSGIPLGDNVTLRPGALAQVMGEAAVHAVDAGRMLREILSGTLLAVLSTPPWSELIRVVNPALVTNYVFGPPAPSDTEPITATTIRAPRLNDLWPEPEESEVHDPRATITKVLDGRVVFEDESYATGDTVLHFRILDADGNALTAEDLNVAEDKRLHLILVRDDLSRSLFQHLHPEEQDGIWIAPTHFDEDGDYLVYVDITPVGQVPVALRSSIAVGADPQHRHDVPPPDLSYSYFDNPFLLELTTRDLVASEEMTLEFRLTKDGKPFPGIQKEGEIYGHLVLLEYLNSSVYVHAHAREVPEDGVLKVQTRFPYAGRYTLFMQLRVEGVTRTIRAFPLIVDVSEPSE